MPSKYIPFDQNGDFTGRKEELEALERRLFAERTCRKIAVVGLGGIGKTQIALQFAYSVLEKHPDVSVFWVHALNAETFEQACRAVASVLGIRGAEDGKEDMKELVQRYLSTERAGKWMLVVDNADDIVVLEGFEGGRGILNYLPESESGLMLFTTRDKKTAQALPCKHNVFVKNMTIATASDLFKKAVRREAMTDDDAATPDLAHDEAAIFELLSELECLPLAITQAAAYIYCNVVPVSEYLDLVRGTNSELVEVMSEEMRDHTQYKQAASAVARTWLVSFKRIARGDTVAADLLQYMCCIDWKAIPRSMLPIAESKARTTTAIGTLCSYSFITRRHDGQTYDMHRLVHMAARVWVCKEELMEETQRKALEHLSEVFPSDDYDNREAWREYIPHAARVRDARGGDHIGARGKLCLKVGRCLRVDGRIRDAVSWLEESRELRKELSEDHVDRLLTEHYLAGAYLANGQVKEAMQLLEHEVAIRVRVLAEDHPDRLASQHELAAAYQANGQVKDAVPLLKHVVAIRERVLAEDHPDRLASQHELAVTYQANGQVKEAVQLLEHVVAIEERVLAEDHPDRLASKAMLARAHRAYRELERFVSQSFSQLNDRGPGSPSATRSIAELEKPLPRRSQRTKPPAYSIPSQVEGNEEGERGKLGNFSRKRKRK
jgi:tetratricopeptide (TPR) repeat protein